MLAHALRRLRLTVKHHRFEVYSIAALALVVVAGSLFEAFRLNSIQVAKQCESSLGSYNPYEQGPDPYRCSAGVKAFADILNGPDLQILRLLSVLFPFVAGLVLAAPIVAKEIEQGTAPLSWALVGSRARWLASKSLALLAVLATALVAVALASDFLFAAINRGLDPHGAFADYEFRGAMLITWGLAAFAGTLALSAIVRRTLPVVILALIACVIATGLSLGGMRHFILPPMSVALADTTTPFSQMGPNTDWRTNLIIDFKQYLHGREITQAEWDAWNRNQWQPALNADGTVVSLPDGQLVDVNGKPQPVLNPEDMPYGVPFGLEGSKYWLVVGIETAILLAGGAVCAGIGFFVVGRRRPY